MTGLSIGHVTLLLLIAFLVYGPQRFEGVIGALGQTVNQFQRGYQGLPTVLDTRPTAGKRKGGPATSAPGTAPLDSAEILDHVEETRRRIFRAVVPTLVLAAVCFFFSDNILRVLKDPAGPGFAINGFGPMDGFFVKWKVAIFASIVLSSPIWIYQIVAMIASGLAAAERRLLAPGVTVVAVLMLLGIAFGYVLLRGMIRVMFTMFGREIVYVPNADQYVSFVVLFMLACGLVFEMPAVLLVLMRFGILAPQMLRRQRKIAYFLLFVFAEVITPVADPIVAPAIVMLPLVILYEGAIVASRWVIPAGEASAAGTSSA
jgi:sec-independent protein translocase protein TatC